MLGALLGCASAPPRTVELQRTAHGVAHIQASDLESLGVGVGWAQAEDRFCLTADWLVTVRGERSRWFGPEARGLLGLRSVSNAQSDFFVQWHMDDARLERAWARDASASAQALARGFVAGFNRYLAQPAEGLPAACRAQPWLAPMTLAEYRRLTELSAVQAGVAAFADAILAAAPPRPTQRGALPTALPVDLAAARDELRERGVVDPPLGSNGWAFGKDSSADGRGLLLGNPHFPWEGPNRFWQFHATVPGVLDVMGAATGVSPLPQIGFNRDVAWTHTVSTGKRFTLHELALVPGTPTVHRVDGRTEALVPRTLRIQVREADGRLGQRETTVWTSRYGPLLVIPRAGLGWSASRAYALQDANSANARSLDVWLGFAQARRVEDFRPAMARLGLPWVNTLAADRHGQALYADASVVPDVNADQLRRCAPSPAMGQLFAAAGLPVLDGSRSECNWRRDELSPVPGLTPIERLPVMQRADWVQNSNDSHWLSNPALQLSGISPMVGAIGSPQRMRTRTALHEFEAQFQPRDAAPRRLDRAGMQALLLAHRNHAAALVLDDLLEACAAGPERREPAVHDGCEVLRAWDRRNHLDARGAHLFREWWRLAKDIPEVWRVPANPEDPAATPAGLRLAAPAVRASVFEALTTAVRTVREAGFALDAPLARVQFRRLPRGDVGIPGGDEFEGVLNKVEAQARLRLGPQGYAIDYGSSYLQAVGFDARGPVAEGLLVYGQSPDPASPWYFDALERLGGPDWPALPFHAADVEKARVGPVQRLLLP